MNQNQIELLLDKHFRSIKNTILSKQNPITGLLPASTDINSHGNYTDAWVRDNVYSILSVWGLSISYKKHMPEHNRTHLLSQSVVKLMRGLLISMMRQSNKVENFKNTLQPIDALHAKYSTHTGLSVVGDGEWGHLQLDATSVYLLSLVQMIASGLKIIYTMDEVNFIQNLVHYISHTYCTADYGIWERGNKMNHGMPEINCSSVGMAKAALESINGFNLFGNVSSKEAVIHVVPNDIARSRFTLEGLLPRESNSKETDAALLSIIGYPAYAIENEELVNKTRDKILKKLGGNYGCKRFLLDGHQSSIEDESRLHYEPSELRKFENIESQWPLFFTYLLLDAIMRGDQEEITKWQKKLEPLFVQKNGEKLLPELYIVPEELIEAEKENPNSQKRVPNENLPLVWAQSLYGLSKMMLDKILRPSDIDPLNRRERIGYQRSTYPLVSILAQNDEVKQKLLNLGFKSQTINDVQPIRVMYSDELSKVHSKLGKNDKLNLSGRPFIETRTMTTSFLHILGGQEIIFLPYYFNPKGFYFSYDNKLLVDHFRSSLKFLSLHWDNPGQPIITFLVREDMLIEKDIDDLLELLNDLQNGFCDDIKVKTGPLGQLLNTAAVERIDHIHNITLNDIKTNPYHINIDEEETIGYTLNAKNLQEIDKLDNNELLDLILNNKNRLKSVISLEKLCSRVGMEFRAKIDSKDMFLCDIAEHQYELATKSHDWAVVRRLAEITKKYDDRLEDALLDIVIRQKQLAVGRAYHEKATISQPLDSIGIIKSITEFCGQNTAENILSQEIIIHLGHLIRTKPELFENILTLRAWYYIQLLVGQISSEEKLSMGDSYEYLLSLSPHEIYDRLRSLLQSFTQKVSQLKEQETLHASGLLNIEQITSLPIKNTQEDVANWEKWRIQSGMIGHLSSNFHKKIWYILQQCKGLVIGDKYNIQNRIGSEVTLESTANERSFEILVDTQLRKIEEPEYRQLNIELIESLDSFFMENNQIHIQDDLVLDVLIGYAVRIAWCKEHDKKDYDNQRGQAWESFYSLSPKQTHEAFLKAFIHLLDPKKDK